MEMDYLKKRFEMRLTPSLSVGMRPQQPAHRGHCTVLQSTQNSKKSAVKRWMSTWIGRELMKLNGKYEFLHLTVHADG